MGIISEPIIITHSSLAFKFKFNVKSTSTFHSNTRYSLFRNLVIPRIQANSEAEAEGNGNGNAALKKKVVIVGAGWAGLGAAHHLSKQGFDVKLLEAGRQPGGLVAGWKTVSGRSAEVGIHGFWYPYRNIFSLTDDLGIQPFTNWTRSAQYSPNGLEVESPIFQDLPRLPSPLGTFAYTQFWQLPLVDRLTSLLLMYAVIDFDNTDTAWRKYDNLTARELFKQFGCSTRVYEHAFNPMLLVGLFAPGEQCSAAATLGMLYYFILAHQQDFDVVWCRGTVGEKIFKPWIECMKTQGCQFLANKRVTDIVLDENTGTISAVACGNELFPADAVIFSVGITALQRIVSNSPVLKTRDEFLNIFNLGAIDVLAVRLWLDRKVNIPKPSNACFGFDRSTGWTFFDLTALHDEYKDELGTVVEADFYHANQFLPLKDEQIVQKVKAYLTTCIKDFGEAKVLDQVVVRFPKSVTHFSPELSKITKPIREAIKGDKFNRCPNATEAVKLKIYCSNLPPSELAFEGPYILQIDASKYNALPDALTKEMSQIKMFGSPSFGWKYWSLNEAEDYYAFCRRIRQYFPNADSLRLLSIHDAGKYKHSKFIHGW